MTCSGNHRSRNRGKHTHLDGLKFVFEATLCVLSLFPFLFKTSDELFRSEESGSTNPIFAFCAPTWTPRVVDAYVLYAVIIYIIDVPIFFFPFLQKRFCYPFIY